MKALLLVLISVTVLAGCGNKERERGAVRVRGTDAAPAVQPGGTVVTPGAPFARVYGDIKEYTTNNVLALMSATPEIEVVLDAQDKVPGIALSGDMQLNGTTQDIRALGSSSVNIKSGSEFVIYILDNLTVTNGVKAITIAFKPGQNGYAVSGTVGGGNANLVFRDQFGDIMLNGTYNANGASGDFTGMVKFKNSVGEHAGQEITLGRFRVPTCGFFHCQ